MISYLETVMSNCYQTPGLSILQHGQLVHNTYNDIRSNPHLYKLPDWWNPDLYHKVEVDANTLQTYHIYHDLGKPFVRQIDEQGRQHFPNHAVASSELGTVFGFDPTVCYLFAHDMDIHIIKDIDVENFCQNPYAITLLLTGLAEIYANASMFGGIDSTSFKIKYRQIQKRGQAILKTINR